jgi:hypothetical protein
LPSARCVSDQKPPAQPIEQVNGPESVSPSLSDVSAASCALFKTRCAGGSESGAQACLLKGPRCLPHPRVTDVERGGTAVPRVPRRSPG